MPKAHKNVALWKYYKCKDLGPWPAEDSSHTTFKGIADWLHSIISDYREKCKNSQNIE